MSIIITKLITLPGIIIGLSLHEFAHAKVSSLLGDPTPKQQGRVTISPFAHIDVIGFIMLLLCGFGWGKPVQINPAYYKHRRRDEFLVSIAGVIMNFILAILFAFPTMWAFRASMTSSLMEIVFEVLFAVVQINLCLMLFNLIPVPPLDGFGIVTQLFNLQKYSWYYRIYQYGSIILLILIVSNATSLILTPAMQWLLNIIFTIVS
ncbi:MAG: site-2 protease family protein [Clostridiales bacterium]|nr:site-2 protease family protein [Candidatus Crickella merdequi]